MIIVILQDAWEVYQRDIYPAVLQNENNDFLNHVLNGNINPELQYAIDTELFMKPVLILTGKQDTSVGYEDQFKWLKPYPEASYFAIEGAGHNLSMDQPRLFHNIVLDWLMNF